MVHGALPDLKMARKGRDKEKKVGKEEKNKQMLEIARGTDGVKSNKLLFHRHGAQKKTAMSR